MAARRPSFCLFCQARQCALSRRRPAAVPKRRVQTVRVAVTPEDDGFLLDGPRGREKELAENEQDGPTLSAPETLRQVKLHLPVDDLRTAALGFEALWQRRDVRLSVLRSLSNPWPAMPAHQRHVSTPRQSAVYAQMDVIPHERFRHNLKAAVGAKFIRQVLRQQLLLCEWPREILRVVAAAMMNKETAENLSAIDEPLMRALYRCRQNVSDPEVLKCLHTIMTRFRGANLYVSPWLDSLALKFAARSRSLPAMKRHLKAIRMLGNGMTSNLFRSVIAKFSIGHRGLGEIRNGRWRRSDLLQVLTGFDDAKSLPPDQQYHLGSFLDRDDWQFLHGWVAALARCKDSESVWEEWEMWKQSDSWTRPKELMLKDGGRVVTTKTRGSHWFVEQMTYAGDTAKAWKMLEETSIPFHTLKMRVKDRLLENVELATVLTDDIRAEIVDKYDRDLTRIEEALGVKWISSAIHRHDSSDPLIGNEEEADGQHVLFMDQVEALDRLGDQAFQSHDEYRYGFPTDGEPIVPPGERPLHDATENAG